MKKMIAVAAAAFGLTGCVGLYDGFGVGVGYGNYGYGGYDGYNRGYGGYGYDPHCIARDRYGRAVYVCNQYYGSYGYTPQRPVYYYPGYTYRQGYYYDQRGTRYDGQRLYRKHHGKRGRGR